ncbi:MAG: GTPase domain-containing protein, partial [Psychrobium sp.]
MNSSSNHQKVPSFAVVGHPNKGKSSVVSTLARNDQIAISMQSGTTVVSETFDINIGQAHYRLVDTPGFQRPRKVLAWLQQEAVNADQRAERIRTFLQDEECRRQFPDEA